PSRVHGAGFLTFEARVTYPFHPLVGQTVLVTGSHQHDGVDYFLIRQSHGGSFQIPAWMFDPEASSIEIVAELRLSATKLVELRAFVDSLVTCCSVQEAEGIGHEKAISHAIGSVRHSQARESERQPAPGSINTPATTADGSGRKAARRAMRRRQKGGGQ
ncbi:MULTISPECIES: DUF5372 family protein, partial [unclassified Neorhizobium]|uniref:DUF5372 family protein n=1 Tax=unclassified Neorhizobium TaxID=2629175 RepID=UPI001FF40A97